LTLGKKLTLNLSLIIIFVLTGYGYFHIQSRREVLTRLMQGEAKSIGEILRVSLEKISFPSEMAYVQEILDAVSEPRRTLGAIFFYYEKQLIFHSQSIAGDLQEFLKPIQEAIREKQPQEAYGQYQKKPVFSYAFPLKDKRGKILGGVSIIQHASFLEEEIRQAKWMIFFVISLLIGGTLMLVFSATRLWVTMPIGKLMEGIQKMAQGDLDTRVDLHRGNEISALGQAFNQMASDLKKAQEKIIQDTETKLELERNLRQSEKLATIGQLASELAHEIGTPLNIISGRAELTRRKLEDPETIKKNLNTIVQQTEKITKIIHQLLGFVRKKKPEQTHLPIVPLLESTLDFLDQKIENQGVQVRKNFAASPLWVKGDPDQLQQVFLNVILNAIQSMPDGGNLQLAITSRQTPKRGLGGTPEPYVEIVVTDTGSGIPSEMLENIFTPFFTTKEKGTGLGLTVSNGIVQDHDGWIEVESNVGQGSTFRIFLPMENGNLRGPDDRPPQARKEQGSG
jgi:signal transduction histidine kinase